VRRFLVKFFCTLIVSTILLSSVGLCNLTVSAYSDWNPNKAIPSISYPISDLSISDDLIPSVSQTSDGLIYFDGTGCDFSKDVNVNNLHRDSEWNFISDKEGCDEVIKKCYQTFRAWGMTKEGAAAFCGNIAGESGGDPSTFGGSWSVKWEDDRVLDSSGNYKGFNHCGGLEYGKGDFGFGLIGFTVHDLMKLVFYIAGHEGKDFIDLDVQLLALSYLYGPRSSVFEDVKTSKMFQPFYDENDDGMNLIGYWNWDSYITDDLSGSSSEDKVKRLTAAFMCNIEVCAWDGSSGRSSKAIEYYNAFKDLEPYDYGENSVGVHKNGGSSDSNGIVSLNTIVSEWDLTGMPSQSGLVSDLNIPGLADTEMLERDFTVKQRYSIYEINKSIELKNEFDAWTKARVVIVFIGLLFMVYAILLALALMLTG